MNHLPHFLHLWHSIGLAIPISFLIALRSLAVRFRNRDHILYLSATVFTVTHMYDPTPLKTYIFKGKVTVPNHSPCSAVKTLVHLLAPFRLPWITASKYEIVINAISASAADLFITIMLTQVRYIAIRLWLVLNLVCCNAFAFYLAEMCGVCVIL